MVRPLERRLQPLPQEQLRLGRLEQPVLQQLLEPLVPRLLLVLRQVRPGRPGRPALPHVEFLPGPTRCLLRRHQV